jgi:REP element-mobilizing transposase RayT
MDQNKFDLQKHHRRSIRLQGYDYSQAGAYFVTIVAWHRECLFGEIVDGEMKSNRYGEIIQKWWGEIPVHFPNVETGAFIIMPNHIHGIMIITEDRRGAVPAPNNKPNLNSMASSQKQGEIIGQDETMKQDVSLQRGGETAPLHHRRTLGQVVAYFKYQSTKEMNLLDGTGVITKFWQRNYHDRIIRNEREMDAIWQYIETNPSAWEDDEENLLHVKS